MVYGPKKTAMSVITIFCNVLDGSKILYIENSTLSSLMWTFNVPKTNSYVTEQDLLHHPKIDKQWAQLIVNIIVNSY